MKINELDVVLLKSNEEATIIEKFDNLFLTSLIYSILQIYFYLLFSFTHHSSTSSIKSASVNSFTFCLKAI